MPLKKLKIKNFSATFVLRHWWEEDRSIKNYTVWTMRRRFELGLFCKRDKSVGIVKRNKKGGDVVKKTFNSSNHVNTYTFGLNLIVAKVWVSWKFKPVMEFRID